jgi:hypothetical protein
LETKSQTASPDTPTGAQVRTATTAIKYRDPRAKLEECKNGQQDEPNETATIVPNNMLLIIVMFVGLGSCDPSQRCSFTEYEYAFL